MLTVDMHDPVMGWRQPIAGLTESSLPGFPMDIQWR